MLESLTQPPQLIASEELWNLEFGSLKVIPTSYRSTPSRALLLFESFLTRRRPLVVLDAGAGLGRNALYLARQGYTVYALDFSDVALARLEHAVESAGLNQRVSVVKGSLAEVLPFPAESFDLIVDSYVSCHFTNPVIRGQFALEIRRLLRPHG